MTDAPDPAKASAEGSYTLRIVFAGLILLHHDPVADTLWALFFQPYSTVRHENEDRVVAYHVTKLFTQPELTTGAIQPQLVEGSTLHEFRNRRYLQLGGQHLTLAVDSQENLSFLRAREPAVRTPEDYSFVISAQKLLKERVPELAGQPIPALKSELTKVPYRVPDGERQQLIARLKLDQGRVSTLKRWGEEDGGPAHRFKFADATLPGNEHLARQVVVELQVKGQGRLMQQALNGEGDAGNQKTPLITFEAEADGTVELTFVTGKAHDADPEHLGNHFRGVYQLFGVDELDALEDVALPRPFNASSGTDGDGACTIIQNGGP